MTNILTKAIALTIKDSRLYRKMSQEDLADLCDLDRTYISGIERLVRNPTINSIDKIRAALELSEKDFLEMVIRTLNDSDKDA